MIGWGEGMTRPSHIDRGGHFLLGDRRADGADHGECSWTLLGDNLFDSSPWRVTRLERMPYPHWLGRPDLAPLQAGW